MLIQIKRHLSVILLILVSLIVRFLYLDNFPPLLLQDEANIGFNASCIAQTGRDEWSQSFPLVFKSFGDARQPVYVYVTAVIYKIIGWSPILPRIPSAIAGTMIVLLIYLWIKLKLKSSKTALLAGLVISLSPWTIHLSRMALESNLALCFFVTGIYLFEYISEKKAKSGLIILSAVFLALSAYTYITYRFFLILFLLILAIKAYIKDGRNYFKINNRYFTIPLITLLLVLPSLIMAGNLTRFNQTSFFNSSLAKSIIFQKQNSCHLLGYSIGVQNLGIICRFLYNYVTTPIALVFSNFKEHLSPSFLFFNGDSTFNRNPTQTGEFYVFLSPFFYAGLFLSLKNIKKYGLYLMGFVLGLIPSMLTGEPHMIRLSILIPFVIYFIALAWQYCLRKFKVIWPISIYLLLISFLNFSFDYMISTFSSSQDYLSYAKDIAQIAYRESSQGKTVYIDRKIIPEKQSYIAFWNNMDPLEYQSFDKKLEFDSKGFQRPSQLGDLIYFELPNIGDLVYSRHDNLDAVFITSDKLSYTPVDKITNLTGEYVFGFVYDLKTIKQELKVQ